MIATAPAHRVLHRLLTLGTVVALAATMVVVGLSGTASAASKRTWTFSGVTFVDGAELTGSFVMSDTGQMTDVHVTTSGGDTATYGTSWTYDPTNSAGYRQDATRWAIMPPGAADRYILLDLGSDLSSTSEGDVVPLVTSRSYELATNTYAYRLLAAGSIVAGPLRESPVVTGIPTVTGEPQVGETLSGDDSAVTATPQEAEKHHQWLRDGEAISGATGPTYTLSNDDAGHMVAFQVSASANDYPDATPVTSSPVGPVEGGRITLGTPVITGTPVVDGTVSAALPAGTDPADVSVTWEWFRGDTSVGHASTYNPVADDAGHVLTVVATASKAHFDTTNRHATVAVTRPGARLTVTAPAGMHLAGRRVAVTATGLGDGEPFAIRIGEIQVATGLASTTGAVSQSVRVPASTKEGATTLVVTGSASDRTGTATIQVVVKKTLGLRVSKNVMRKRHRQRITVTGLAAGEHVRVAYRGKRISPRSAHADARGVYRAVVRVGRLAGKKTVTATGAFYGRRALVTFRVTRR